YPKLVRTFGGRPAPAAAGGGPGAAKGGDSKGKGAAVAQGGAPAPVNQAKGGDQAKGKGAPPAPAPVEQMNNPHGNMIDLPDPANPVLLVADRGNRRIVRYTLDDKPIDIIEGTRQPCHFHAYKDMVVVPDLSSRVTLYDKNNKVIAHVCEGSNTNNLRQTENRGDFEAGRL